MKPIPKNFVLPITKKPPQKLKVFNSDFHKEGDGGNCKYSGSDNFTCFKKDKGTIDGV